MELELQELAGRPDNSVAGQPSRTIEDIWRSPKEPARVIDFPADMRLSSINLATAKLGRQAETIVERGKRGAFDAGFRQGASTASYRHSKTVRRHWKNVLPDYTEHDCEWLPNRCPR
jgi:hypothetical protein